jgi:hypothetical protein
MTSRSLKLLLNTISCLEAPFLSELPFSMPH